MDACRVPPEQAMHNCSWCGKPIPDDTPVYGLSGKKRPGMDVSEFEGGAIQISLVSQDRHVIAIVPPADSDARQDGNDLLFMVCSEICGFDMKTALEDEIALGDAFFGEIGGILN